MTRVRDLKDHRFDCAVVLIMAAALVSCGGSEPPPQREVVRPVKLLTVGSGMAGAPRVYPGRIEAKNRVELSFRVGGPLIEFPVREGTAVRAGGVVARIDPRDFQIRLEAARADRERTTADFQRYASLYEKDAVSQTQLDQRRAAMEVAQATLDDATAALKDTTLYAPYAAQVAERLVALQRPMGLLRAGELYRALDEPAAARRVLADLCDSLSPDSFWQVSSSSMPGLSSPSV